MRPRAAIVAALAAALLAGLFGCRRPAEPPFEALPRGHSEVALAGERVAPLFVGRGAKAGLCFEVPPGRDTSRWRGRILVDGEKGDWQDPALRRGSLLCFGGPLPAGLERLGGRRAFELCAEIRDELTEKTLPKACLDSYFEPDGAPLAALEAEREALLAAAKERPAAELAASLKGLAVKAEQGGWPLAGLRIRLIAVHFLLRQGGPGPLAEAAAEVAGLPRWLESPIAGYFGALADYQAGLFAFEAGDELEGWERLQRADLRLRRAGYPTLSTAAALARRLARGGALGEARSRMEATLGECAAYGNCDGGLVLLAKADLAWLILQDGGAGPADLERAETLLRELLAAPAADPLNHANAQLSLAYRRLREGIGADAALAAADAILAAEAPSARLAYYREWRELLGGLAKLGAGDAAGAGRLCRGLAGKASPEIAAWAWGCAGRAARAAGKASAALAAFEQAVSAHELAALAAGRGEALPLGLDQRADAFAQAARAAVEAGDPGRGWDLLARLDLLSASEADRRRCRGAAKDPESRRAWQQLDRQIAGSLEQLAELERSAPLRLQESRRRAAEEVKGRLQELWRSWPGCGRQAAPKDGLHFRAVALEDEILLLGRKAPGIELLRRTPWPRAELAVRLRELEESEPGALTQERWLELARPLAAALLPARIEAAGEPFLFGLHGILQAAPLQALPLPGEASYAPLGGRHLVAVAPAGAAVARRPAAGGAERRATFVLDPGENLAGALQADEDFLDGFPGARLLRGRQATREAFAAALPGSSLLHLDVHGSYDAAFPELSALELADGKLRWLELAELRFEPLLANLSGCRTGLWPISADIGSYGLGGALVRLGVPAAIASRRPLPDQVAADFNRPFYRHLGSGRPWGESFRLALSGLATKHPASAWSGILLIVPGAKAPPADSSSIEAEVAE